MQISRKRFALTIILTATLALSLGYYIQVKTSLQHQKPTPKANVFMFVEKVDAQYWVGSGNVITDIGEDHTRDFHSQNTSSVNALNWISIGNVSAGSGKTQLDSQYDRKLGSITEWTNSGDYALNVTYTWMFNETQRIDGAGSHWSSSGDNNLYACANFIGGAVTFNTNDNCTIIWIFTYDAN